jgi:hypothetical protein
MQMLTIEITFDNFVCSPQESFLSSTWEKYLCPGADQGFFNGGGCYYGKLNP